MKSVVTLIFFLVIAYANAQVSERIQLRGIIRGEGVEREGISVLNESTDDLVKTDASGNFIVNVKLGDVLVIASIYIDGKNIQITQNHLSNKTISIYVQPNVNALDEVEITNLDAVSLGILTKPAKTYTPAERRLQTAGDFKPVHLLGLLGGSLQFDPILNAINGRTKRLKKEVSVEKKEDLIERVGELLASSELRQMLQIPNEYLNGFSYYVIENKEFVATFNTNNSSMITLMLVKLAPEYIKTL